MSYTPNADLLPRNKKNSADTSEFCRSTYESSDIVEHYAKQDVLSPPEQTILNLLRNRLPQMSMLDIGCGAGRTTQHFASLTKDYIGVDYAANMIARARKKFPELRFEVADARNLSVFNDGRFDFTLFSYNGLDYMNHEDRVSALKEMHRVTTKRGCVCMSTHNLNCVPELFTFNFSARVNFPKNLVGLVPELCRLYRFRSLNVHLKKSLQKVPYLLLNDGAHGFRLITHYIKPDEQVRNLTTLGFANIRVFNQEGIELMPVNLTDAKDFWLYFLCMPT